ncbi:hypothetical protein N665_3676s0001 [Sinapis alba]|nr:hypothetical protein N665_3676s0001 [Sinapis alba]
MDGRNIRNICILAHVDHGKTTLADHLIASSGGGVLHPRLAGKLRYMDYLDEEQRRAITMKSSSISLRYKDYSLNLIDSPGHMDFCSEVSTAARLSDGALVLVDAVEGVHIQTHAVLRQAWIEKLTPCLVLNKIDRLICELRLSPMEAYTRLIRIVHEVNGIVSAYKSEKYLSDVDSILASPSGEITDESLELLEDDEEVTFQPQKGNVVFVCALDGWGFGISEFANFYASKLGAKADALQKSLWGPRYYVPKKKMIVGKKSLSAGSKAKPMFVQFVLEPLAAVLQTNPRIVEAMYFCELNTAPEYLGPMYAVLSRRRARVLKEEMQEGSSLFTVHAYVPVSESFGFADELRKGTSGGASALMVLSHWEMLEEDPFFVPKTEEEIEEFGDGASVLPNTARKLINAVRRRKGLHVEEKVVQHATKQRTLARKV